MSTPLVPRRVPVSELRPGHVTWRYDEKGKIYKDVEIKDYFPRGGPHSLDPAFRTKDGRMVIYYHGCTELVTGTPR